jgi:hypothetical protein
MVSYADDTVILVEDVLKLKIEFAMKELEVWFLNNELILNITKTCAMPFHSSQFRHPCKPYSSYNNNDISSCILLPTICALLLYIYSFT